MNEVFIAHLRTKGIVHIGLNPLGVITNLTREARCTLGYNDIELMWETWQAAISEAVAEGGVIVPQLSANYLFNTVPELGFVSQDQKDAVLYHLNYMASEFKDSAKQFVNDDHAKQKAMLEAQEQSHD